MTTQATDYQALFRELDPVMDNAMASNDGPALETLLADDFIYTHSNNHHQNKEEFIAAIVARPGPPKRLLTEVEAEVHGDIAVTRGQLDVIYDDGRPTLVMRYVRVYRNEGGNWRPFSHKTLYATDRQPAS